MNESATEPEGIKPEATSTVPEATSAEPEATVPEATSAEPERPTGLSLYILRHADAGDPMTWAGDDADRPLSKKGRRQAKRLGRHLRNIDAQPEAVLTSPKLRSFETARIVAKSIGRKPSTDERLALDFGDEALASLVSSLGADVRGVMLVGHDPDFSQAVSWLVGSSIDMRKGALALIDLPDRAVGAGRGSLRWLLPPDAVPG